MPTVISSKLHLFRRAGVAHPKNETTYPDGRFTAEELKILQSEKMLTVRIVEPSAPSETLAEQARKFAEGLTVAELTTSLADRNIDLPKGAKKAGLVELFVTAASKPEE